MTYFHINVMWAIVLFGVLLWSTVSVVLNAALRRGMGTMSMVLCYFVFAWMLYDLPLRDAITTWLFFALQGGIVMCLYELWARRHFAGSGRTPRSFIRLDGLVRWPMMMPDAFGMVLNDLGILPTDDRSESAVADEVRVTAEHAAQVAAQAQA